MIKQISIVVLLALMSACAGKMPPQPEPFPLESVPGWEPAAIHEFHATLSTELLNSEMQLYITEVLQNNADLKSVAATARAIRENVIIARAASRPSMNLSLSAARSKNTATNTLVDSADVSSELNLPLDVWGRNRNTTKAERFSSDNAYHKLRQARNELIKQAAQAWVTYWSYTHIESRLASLVVEYAHMTAHFEESYRLGLIPLGFFIDAKNRQEQNTIRFSEAKFRKAEILRFMNTLRGRLPAEELEISSDKVPLMLVQLDKKISAAVLVERPDIQAAFSELKAYYHFAAAAHRALLPQISLSGSASKSGETVRDALKGDLLWRWVGGLTQPLFNGGQLRAAARQRTAEAESAWWRYRETVLKAVLEVENGLGMDKLLAEQIEQQEALLHDYLSRTQSAKEKFSRGEIAFADYLRLKVECLEARVGLSEVQRQYLKNRLSLVVALGLPVEVFEDKAYENS